MSILLNIDTTTETAIITISKKNVVLDFISNSDRNEHASFLQPAVKELLKKIGLAFKELDAVAVTAGPGSYTGIRVGMASAKGLCYALDIPLITLNTLKVMAMSAIKNSVIKDEAILWCPMIDARRMEVFTGLYDNQLKKILAPCAMVINENSFEEQLQNNKIIFFGSGSLKMQSIINNKNAYFKDLRIVPEALASLAYTKFEKKEFTNLIKDNVLYIKDFIVNLQ